MFYHHNTIRTYTGALLNLFSDLEVQYRTSNSEIHSRNIPITYSTKEKSKILDSHTVEQLTTGNYNVLPRANLTWSAMIKADQRTTNKNLKINTKANEDTFEFLYNGVPYEFTYELTVICRGLNEATMIIEQVASKFNPTVNIDVYDATNLNEPTRIPVTLLDIGVTPDEFEELSNNIISISFGLSIKGMVYPPIRSIERIKDFKIFLSERIADVDTKKSVLQYDVINSELQNEEIFIPEISDTRPIIIEIVGSNVIEGENDILVIWEDEDSTIREITFEWFVLSGDATILGDKDNAKLFVNSPSTIEVMCKITDESGNYTSSTKTFIVL